MREQIASLSAISKAGGDSSFSVCVGRRLEQEPLSRWPFYRHGLDNADRVVLVSPVCFVDGSFGVGIESENLLQDIGLPSTRCESFASFRCERQMPSMTAWRTYRIRTCCHVSWFKHVSFALSRCNRYLPLSAFLRCERYETRSSI